MIEPLLFEITFASFFFFVASLFSSMDFLFIAFNEGDSGGVCLVLEAALEEEGDFEAEEALEAEALEAEALEADLASGFLAGRPLFLGVDGPPLP